MASLTLRSTKGSPLTIAEVDANFTSLNSLKVEQTGGTGSAILPAGTTAQRDAAPSGGFIRFNTDTTQAELFNGTGWSTVGGATLSNDTSTNGTFYPTLSTSTSGTATTLTVSSSKLSFNPSTGTLTTSTIRAATNQPLSLGASGNGGEVVVTTGNITTPRFTFHTSGNMSVGDAAPVSVGTNRALSLGATGNMIIGDQTGSRVGVSTNFDFSTGNYTKIRDGGSALYDQFAGGHRFLVSSSGTAGSAFTFTTAMSITAQGSVGIGTTSPSAPLHVVGTAQATLFSGSGASLTNLSASNITSGTLALANGGTGATTAAAARTSLGATTVGANLFTLANPSAVSFPRLNADNTVSTLSAADFRAAIGAGTSSTDGTVTSVSGTGTVSGLTLTGTVTSSGALTLGGTLAVTPSNFSSQTANTFLAAPNGAAGAPTFRSIVAADIPTLNQNTTGSAGSLATARTINGTSFNGTANITTATWGTVRTIAIGSSGKSVDGSGNVSWTLDEIGATNASIFTTGTMPPARLASGTANSSTFLRGDQTWATPTASQVGALPIAGGSLTGLVQTRTSTGSTSTTGSVGTLEVMGSSGLGAVMSFHRSGSYAVHMGLDTDNVIRIGGWSAPANLFQMDMSGNLTMAGNITAFSDERKKTDWLGFGTDFIDRLSAVKSGTYTRTDTGERQVGVSAQDLQQVLPEAVMADAEGTLSVAYGQAALAAVIELARRVVEQDQRIAQLESLVQQLITRD